AAKVRHIVVDRGLGGLERSIARDAVHAARRLVLDGADQRHREDPKQRSEAEHQHDGEALLVARGETVADRHAHACLRETVDEYVNRRPCDEPVVTVRAIFTVWTVVGSVVAAPLASK